MRRYSTLALSFLVLATVAAYAAPTAILVDTSRSISPARFRENVGAIESLLPALTAKGPVAVYTFDDKVAKAADFTQDASALKSTVGDLKQAGTFTLLYDGLFTAARDLEGMRKGGTILLVTDGRDENSAVTLEDVTSRCNGAGISVATVGTGASVDAKVLRRIATLTGGKDLGILPSASAEEIRAGLDAVLSAAKAQTAPAPSAASGSPGGLQGTSSPPASPAPQAHRIPPDGGLPWLWILVILVLAGLAISTAMFFLVLKRTKPMEDKTCQKCGRELNLWETECPICLAKALSITNPGFPSEEGGTPVAPAIPEMDPVLLQKAPATEQLENTIVMDEVPVLVLKRGNNPPRMFQLPPDQVVSVGRDKVCTISVADPTLSGQHFRVVPKEGAYYLVDLHSTNGTFLNGERATLKEIPAGAVIHAGQCDFQFRKEQRRLN